MSSSIHLKRNPILLCCIPVLLLIVLVVLYHEEIFDAPSGKRRLLQAELHERIKVTENATLKHLPIFRGGVPKRIVIFTNEYSKFEYLEEILLTIPGVFIHKAVTCDPASDAGDDRDWSLQSNDFRNVLIKETLERKVIPLLHCKRTETHELVGSSSILSEDMLEYCKENPIICSSEYFQQKLCEMSTLQVLVLKNFDFNMALELQKFKYLHLVYMIRDPRAIALEENVLRSGSCTNFTHCFDVQRLCRSMKHSESAVKALVKVPRHFYNFNLVRLEELAYNMMQEMQVLFKQWGIQHTIDTYTVMSELKPKIDKMAFDWPKGQSYKDIEWVQEICDAELKFYAYRIILSESELELDLRTVNDLASRLVELGVEDLVPT